MIFDAAMIEAPDDRLEPAPVISPQTTSPGGRAAVHLRQDGDRWTWLLISEDGRSVAAGQARTRLEALRHAQDADRP